ncbi:polyketide synthase type I [Micromonospora arborensis]|uniref:Polyketide synthase type I n=1 Tax=Micromonospora arborensis TaxID=2116518 RepID=A0A318NFY3_9ACTN|nr:thioester reductase domain-containing protein [Micromonospora arborensis]PYC66839.1 polyketide synthase type I [Micromonospora arborensis]
MSADTDIAIIGVGCRFPDAWTPGEFWGNVRTGHVSTRELSDEQLRAAGVDEAARSEPDFVGVGAALPGAADFAADFFGYLPPEAETTDPQQRLFLEVCWEALESSGHPARPEGPVVGVFAGASPSAYMQALFAAKAAREGLAAAVDDFDLHLGGQVDFLTSRVAYKLGLRGPAVGVQTACSSALYAVHYAVLSLLSGECDIALAGGASVSEPVAGYRYVPGGLMSADGMCRAFDARSTGTSFTSGVGAVVLRRLADAQADGDTVLAVVRGSAVGNDGSDRSGFTAPSPSGVADVVSAALRVAGVSGDQLRYVEAHGSGTSLGDQIELRGLADGIRATTGRTGFCALGSVKVNIGHCGSAAGIAGLIQAVQVAHTGVLPPHPLFEQPRNPGALADSPLYLSREAGVCADADRHVLVNSMGLGGTNVAVVLGAPPAPTRPSAPTGDAVRLLLSARNRTELDAMSRRLADVLDTGELAASDVAYTLRVGRQSFTERRVVTAPADQLAAALRLPRPPAARTVRANRLRPVLVLPPDNTAEAAVLDRLRAALGPALEIADQAVVPAPPGRFTLLLGDGTSGRDAHVLPVRPSADDVDEALANAWLHGVDVDWAALPDPAGRRVPLPTYPFQRRRYWALDRIGPMLAPAAPAAATVPVDGDADPVEVELVRIWRELFGVDGVGLDDEFGALGGSSLLSVRMALEIQRSQGVLVNVHRAGGSQATIRRLAKMVRGLRGAGGAGRGPEDIDEVADGDGALVDADLDIDLGPLATEPAEVGTDVLLTGATGFLGAFLLHELLATTSGRVYCIVRAADEESARERLATTAEKFALPVPDPERVHVVLGDLSDIATICATYRDGELARRVGSILHCAAKVVFTEPYRTLRQDNVLSVVDLVRWARRHGIRDVGFVSTVAATHYALGTDGRILETREQPLDPLQGGYGVSKWVAERILERAERDGMRIRVFRPGFILGSTRTGACNDKDLIWAILASGLAVGAHPLDDRSLPMAPVDHVARAMAELTVSRGAAGRAFHLVDRYAVSPRRMFQLLAEAGLPTEATPADDWQQRVSAQALDTGNKLLSTVALYEQEGHELDETGLEAEAWQSWLTERGLRPAPSGELLRTCLTFLADRDPAFGELLNNLLKTTNDAAEVR